MIINVISDILYLIGLIIRNHFLLLPFIITSIIRTLVILFLLFSLYSLFGASITAVITEVCVMIVYNIATIYIFGINIVMFRRFSGNYYERIRVDKIEEPVVSFTSGNEGESTIENVESGYAIDDEQKLEEDVPQTNSMNACVSSVDIDLNAIEVCEENNR